MFQPFNEEDDNYGGSDSLLTSSRDSIFSQVEVESSDIITMPVMVTVATNLVATNFEEQLAGMKATLERLLKENVENDAQIKRQNKQIVDLTKKLEKWTSEASNKRFRW